jgi:hypothetical protein
MFIQVQTKVTQPVTIYDSTAPVVPSDPNSLQSRFIKWLQPVVQVKMSDGTTLYKTGEFYTPVNISKYALIGTAGIVAALMTLGIILKVRR